MENYILDTENNTIVKITPENESKIKDHIRKYLANGGDKNRYSVYDGSPDDYQDESKEESSELDFDPSNTIDNLLEEVDFKPNLENQTDIVDDRNKEADSTSVAIDKDIKPIKKESIANLYDNKTGEFNGIDDETGLYRYRFTQNDDNKIDRNLSRKLSDNELSEYMQANNFKDYKPMQASYQNVVGAGAGSNILKTAMATSFPRTTENYTKGQSGANLVPEAVLDVASMPFRAVAGLGGSVVDAMTNQDRNFIDKTNPFYQTETDTEKYDANTGQVVEPNILSSLLQSAIRAPENALGIGGATSGLRAASSNPASKVASLLEAVNTPASRLQTEAVGNVLMENLRANTEERQPSLLNTILGGVTPLALSKLAPLPQKFATTTLEKKLKVNPSLQKKRFAPDDTKALFESGIIGNNVDQTMDNLKNKLSSLGRERAQVAKEYDKTTDVMNLPSLKEISQKVSNELVDQYKAGRLRQDDMLAINNQVAKEVDDLSKLAYKSTDDVADRLPVSRLLNRRSTWFDEGKLNDMKTIQDIAPSQRRASNLLWEATSGDANKVNAIQDINSDLRKFIPWEKALQGADARMQNKNYLPAASGGDIFTLLKMLTQPATSLPSLKATYKLGDVLSGANNNFMSPRTFLTPRIEGNNEQ